MSVVCYEDGRKLFIADEAFCITTEEAETYSAICDSHIAAIPLDERLNERVTGRLDIHFLFGRPNGYSTDLGVDTLSFTNGLRFGDYRFSVNPAIAQLVLPRACQLYLR